MVVGLGCMRVTNWMVRCMLAVLLLGYQEDNQILRFEGLGFRVSGFGFRVLGFSVQCWLHDFSALSDKGNGAWAVLQSCRRGDRWHQGPLQQGRLGRISECQVA